MLRRGKREEGRGNELIAKIDELAAQFPGAGFRTTLVTAIAVLQASPRAVPGMQSPVDGNGRPLGGDGTPLFQEPAAVAVPVKPSFVVRQAVLSQSGEQLQGSLQAKLTGAEDFDTLKGRFKTLTPAELALLNTALKEYQAKMTAKNKFDEETVAGEILDALKPTLERLDTDAENAALGERRHLAARRRAERRSYPDLT